MTAVVDSTLADVAQHNGAVFAAPLTAVDRVEAESDGPRLLVSAGKAVDRNDPYMHGHFPGRPVYPGVFLVETFGQAAAVALARHTGRSWELRRIDSVRFLAPLVPGDVVEVDLVVETGAETARVRGTARRQDGVKVGELAGVMAEVVFPQDEGEDDA
ncbi:MAG: beta-hydroxyacyl-ACP dehydratase [Actinobacteria bacterium]|nr:beta-hydroxyacyl-ACP dehydratase [Actinomycetota bacterium]